MENEIYLKIFNTAEAPFVDFRLTDLFRLARIMVGKSSIQGAQPKLLVTLLNSDGRYSLAVMANGEYILKPQSSSPHMPENEHCCLDIATALGFNTPLYCLLPLKDGSLAFVVKRFDRHNSEKIHQEDFAQLMGKKDKYNSSVEEMLTALAKISLDPSKEVFYLFEQITFYFLIGNADGHLKNYSIGYKGGKIFLTPLYDAVSTKLFSTDEKDSPIPLNNKIYNLSRMDFDMLAEKFNIPLSGRYSRFEKKFGLFKNVIINSKLSKEEQGRFVDIVKEGFSKLEVTQS